MSNTYAAANQSANSRVRRALQSQPMYEPDLEPLSPEDAKDRYLRSMEDDKAEGTIRTRRYKLGHFVRWCDEEGIDNLNKLTGRQLEDYKHWRKEDGNLNKTTLRTQMSVIRGFIDYCGKIDGVRPELHERIILPELEEGENQSDDTIEPERIQDILGFMERFEYATRDHVVLLLLWKTGMRTGSLRSLDLDDYLSREPALEINHRPDTGTPLKNKSGGERMLAIGDETADVVDDYIRHNRKDVTDDHGREPLLTTSKGRIGKVTIRRTAYRYTRPCVVTGGCPHGKEPEDCEAATNYDKASKCPDSVSAHPFRRASITHHLNSDVPKPLVSDRMNVSTDVIDKHYDAEDEKGKMERRREYLDNI
jgi:site-specific recombinase XerD